MVKEIIQAFTPAINQNQTDFYADLTLGGAGHTSAILDSIPSAKVLGFDQDLEAITFCKKKFENSSRIKIIHSNFKHFPRFMEKIYKKHPGFKGFRGILLDLGVSSYQLDNPDRGLSFSKLGPLDMRMDAQKENEDSTLMACDIVNNYDLKDLIRVLEEYGELPYAKKLAQAIIEERKKKRIETTIELENIIYHHSPGWAKKKKIHPATCAFQALRIEVNNEIKILETTIEKILPYLCEDGVCAIISFHSLEDRIVKHYFKNKCQDKTKYKLLQKKPIIPSEREIKENPRSRCAKLRMISSIS